MVWGFGKSKEKKLREEAKNGKRDNVETLIEQGAEVDAKDKDYGMTALIWASRNGHRDVVETLLLNYGADINLKDKSGMTALMYASENGYLEVVNLLLNEDIEIENKVNIDADDGKNDPFTVTYASVNGKTEVVKTLLNHGADIYMKGVRGYSIIEEIDISNRGKKQQEKVKNTKKLLENAIELINKIEKNKNLTENDNLEHVNFKYDGKTPLMRAAYKGNLDNVKLLLNNGAEVDAINQFSNTALMYASRNGKTDVVKTLLNNGADINVQADGNNTALTLAEENKEIQELLGNAKKLIDEIKTEKPSLDNLLEHVNFKYDGKTPLMWASQQGHTEVVEALLGVKWDENEKKYIKIEGRDEKSIADVNLKDPDGLTALKLVKKVLSEHRGGLNTDEINNYNEIKTLLEKAVKKTGGKRKTKHKKTKSKRKHKHKRKTNKRKTKHKRRTKHKKTKSKSKRKRKKTRKHNPKKRINQ